MVNGPSTPLGTTWQPPKGGKTFPPAEPQKVSKDWAGSPAPAPLAPKLQQKVDQTRMNNQVNTALAAQVEIPSGEFPGTGTIVESRTNSDGSTTYYALTAKHVLAGDDSGHYTVEPGSTQMIHIPKYVVTQAGPFPIESMYRDPSGKDLALFSFSVPPGGPPLPVTKVSQAGETDLSEKPITLVGGAPDESTRSELLREGAKIKQNGVLQSYTAPIPRAVPVKFGPPGVWSVPSDKVPTESGTSGSAYVGPNGVAAIHQGVSSRQDGGPDKGNTYMTPVDRSWVNSGVEALGQGTGPDIRQWNLTPEQIRQIDEYHAKYNLHPPGKRS